MQRLQQTLGAGLILGLVLSIAAPAEAQIYYVQSPSYQTVPVAQSVVQTQMFVAPRSSHYAYTTTTSSSSSSSYSYGRYGSNFYRSGGLAWNNRRSAPPIYSETTYLPEVTYHSVAAVPSVVYSEPIYVSQPVVSSVSVVASPSVASSTRVIREQAVCLPEQVESKAKVTVHDSKGRAVKTLQSSTPKVTVSESNGRRVTTHRYEYDLDQPAGRVTIEFESKK